MEFQLIERVVDADTRPWFDDLQRGVAFEGVAKGRLGAVLLDVKPRPADPTSNIPLVRSTTRYAQPHGVFLEPHAALAEAVRRHVVESPPFNNALLELYDHRYRSMGLHTDLALDLAADSVICVVSCYSNPRATDLRAITVQDKVSGERRTIVLPHLSAFVFTTACNARMVHQITAPSPVADKDLQWLGVTLRVSSRSLCFNNEGVPCLAPGVPLMLAAPDSPEAAEFLRLRREENRTVAAMAYPADFNVTLSASDILPPVVHHGA